MRRPPSAGRLVAVRRTRRGKFSTASRPVHVRRARVEIVAAVRRARRVRGRGRGVEEGEHARGEGEEGREE